MLPRMGPRTVLGLAVLSSAFFVATSVMTAAGPTEGPPTGLLLTFFAGCVLAVVVYADRRIRLARARMAALRSLK